MRDESTRRARSSEEEHADLNAVEFFAVRHKPQLDPRLLPLFHEGKPGDVAGHRTGDFNGWAKYDNWRNDNAVPSLSRSELKYAPL